MRAIVGLALRCSLAVAVTTVAVQLWGMAVQDDVPLPVPIFSLPATDSAVAASTPGGRVSRTEPAVVVSAGLIREARRPPTRAGVPVTPATRSVPPATERRGIPPPAARLPDLVPPPRPASPSPASAPPTASPDAVPVPAPQAPVTPPDGHVAPSTPRVELSGPELQGQEDEPAEVEERGQHGDH
jgi:hypothetical protein